MPRTVSILDEDISAVTLNVGERFAVDAVGALPRSAIAMSNVAAPANVRNR